MIKCILPLKNLPRFLKRKKVLEFVCVWVKTSCFLVSFWGFSESSRLACFPWPKEQFVALDEIFGWVMDNSELLDKTCKVVQELHCLHPQNFQEDLLNTIMKRQSQYIKVSTATNKEKLYTTFCSLLTKLFILSRSATNGLNKIIDKMLDSIVNKWITCDVQVRSTFPPEIFKISCQCDKARDAMPLIEQTHLMPSYCVLVG